MAEDKTQKGRGNDFGRARGSLQGHPQASDQPIINKELAQANEKRITEIAPPGIQSSTT